MLLTQVPTVAYVRSRIATYVRSRIATSAGQALRWSIPEGTRDTGGGSVLDGVQPSIRFDPLSLLFWV